MAKDCIQTTCCIVGGGPAGMMLGYLLARSGVDVVVTEKHADFLRDFRGDTIHPSTFELFDQLGLLDELLAITDFQAQKLEVSFEGHRFTGPDFSGLKTVKCKFIGFAPQWNLLNLIAKNANALPNFQLRMNTKATGLIRQGNQVTGVSCKDKDSEFEIHSDLVVGADGRKSTLRSCTNLEVTQCGIPIDVLWFRLDRNPEDQGHTLAWIKNGHMLVTIPRKDYFQVAMIIGKDSVDQVKENGISFLQKTVAMVCPKFQKTVLKLNDWNDVRLLKVQMNQLTKWYEPGLLFIGDSAHAMSPVGGVGINLAIQDAVAASNLLSKPLLHKKLTEPHLLAVQNRRRPAAKKTQRAQAFVHKKMFGPQANPGSPVQVSWMTRQFIKLFGRFIRPTAGRLIGLGFQPEKINNG